MKLISKDHPTQQRPPPNSRMLHIVALLMPKLSQQSDIAPFVRKAWDCWAETTGITMLLPANRTEQQWWQLLVEPYRDRPGSPLRTTFLPGRMRFLKPGQTAVGPNNRPPFGCVLLVWDAGVDATVTYSPDRLPAGGLFDADVEESR